MVRQCAGTPPRKRVLRTGLSGRFGSGKHRAGIRPGVDYFGWQAPRQVDRIIWIVSLTY
jgi:hypothetical protein